MTLLPDQLTLMQRIQDAAGNDYVWYTKGEIALEKWPQLEAKFAGRYEIDLSKSTRYRRRRAGQAVCLLYACSPWRRELRPRVTWVLVVTEGKGRVHGCEALRELRQDRLELDGYELIHDGKGWTWQMTRDRVRYWRERIHAIAAYNPEKRNIGQDMEGSFDVDIERVMDTLYRTPGFRRVRSQVGHLVCLARKEWRRLRPDSGVRIRERAFLPYVQRLSNAKRSG